MTAQQFIQESLANDGLAWFQAKTGREACELLWELTQHPSYEESSDAYGRTERPGFWFYDIQGTHEGREWHGVIYYPKDT